jgi:hypothetical protein
MAETYYPPLSEDRCASLIRAEIDRHVAHPPASTFSLEDIETLIRAAEERSRPRTQLPPALRRFPLTWSPWLQQVILKVYKRLFHDQRAVNTVLIQALRETLAVNRYLLGRLAEQGPSEELPQEEACGS